MFTVDKSKVTYCVGGPRWRRHRVQLWLPVDTLYNNFVQAKCKQTLIAPEVVCDICLFLSFVEVQSQQAIPSLMCT